MRLPSSPMIFILGLVLLTGCGSGPRPKPVSVQGKVVGPKGKLVGPAVIMFWPENSKINKAASAVCEADGSFSLQCLPGNYKLTLSPVRPKGATAAPRSHGSDSAIPDFYQNQLTTPLTLNVPETGVDGITLNLKSEPR